MGKPSLRFRLSVPESWIESGLWFCAMATLGLTVAIFIALSFDTFEFFQEVHPFEFLFGTRWEPLLEPKSFGVLPLVCGTSLIVLGSAVFAIPIGVCSAIYLSIYASPKLRDFIKPVLEIIAGIPSVVFGYFALTFVTPVLKYWIPSTGVFNAASAAIVVGVMILPLVTSLCDDAFTAVPGTLKHGGYAMGATTMEVIRFVIIPASASRMAAAFILAVSRAIGETMAVTLAAGATPIMTLNPLESIQTMTAYIVQISLGDTPLQSIEFQTSIAVGMLLFIVTFVLSALAHRILKRFKGVQSE